MRLELKQHNRVAYERVMAAFEKDRMTCVCHPTGTGKSYIVAAVTEHFKRVLILAPNIFVLRQQQQVISWHKDIEYRSYQWLNNNVTDITEQYDLIVIDEFHRAGAPEWSAAVGLLIESQPQAKVLGTTATPIRYLDGERNMAYELFNGHVASNMTIAEAWTIYNVLPIPRYVSGLFRWDKPINEAMERINKSQRLSDDEKRQRIFRLSNKKLDWEKSYGMPTILRKHLDKDARRVIIFCSHIETLEQMKSEVCGWFREAGFALAGSYILHSQMKDSEQRQQMRGFEADNDSGVKLIFCVDMLNEGVHVPRVSAVLMLRTTSSRIIYMQQMGRCLTAANTEKPLVLDMVDNITTTTAIKGFQEEFELLEREQAEKEHREPRKFEVVDYTLGVVKLIEKLVPHTEAFTMKERLVLVKQFISEHDRIPSQGKDGVMFAHWRWLCTYAADNAEVEALRRKYGWIPLTIDEAIAELDSYNKRTGRFLSFPNQRGNKETERLSGLWQRLRRSHSDHPVVAEWSKRLEEEKAGKFQDTLQRVKAMAERGEKFSKTSDYLYLHKNHADKPEVIALKKYFKPRVILTDEEHINIVEDHCKRTDRLPTFKSDGQACNSYNYLQRHNIKHPRLKALIDRYHQDNKLERRREEDLKAIEKFYYENGYLPTVKTPLGQRWSRIKRAYPDNPDVQRIEKNCRYKQSCAAYVIEDVKIYAEMHGELPTMATNESLYKLWRVARSRHPDNPDVVALINKYGTYRNMPRKHL